MQSLTEAHSGVQVFAGFQQLVVKDKNGAVKLLCWSRNVFIVVGSDIRCFSPNDDQ
jgi:hypothetical protein